MNSCTLMTWIAVNLTMPTVPQKCQLRLANCGRHVRVCIVAALNSDGRRQDSRRRLTTWGNERRQKGCVTGILACVTEVWRSPFRVSNRKYRLRLWGRRAAGWNPGDRKDCRRQPSSIIKSTGSHGRHGGPGSHGDQGSHGSCGSHGSQSSETNACVWTLKLQQRGPYPKRCEGRRCVRAGEPMRLLAASQAVER